MNKLITTARALTVSVAAIAAGLLSTGCTNEKSWSTPPASLIYEVVTEDGYWRSASKEDKKSVAAMGDVVEYTLVLGNRDFTTGYHPYPDFKDGEIGNVSYLKSAYDNSELRCIEISDGTLPDDTYDAATRVVPVKRVSDNSWEGEGFKVEKQWIGERYMLKITIPENTTSTDRLISLSWEMKDNEGVACAFTTFYFLQS